MNACPCFNDQQLNILLLLLFIQINSGSQHEMVLSSKGYVTNKHKMLLLERNCSFVVINKAEVIKGRWTLHYRSSRNTRNTLKRYQWVSKENFLSAPCRGKNWSTRNASRNGENLNYQCSPFDTHPLLLNHLLQQCKSMCLLHLLYFSFLVHLALLILLWIYTLAKSLLFCSYSHNIHFFFLKLH